MMAGAALALAGCSGGLSGLKMPSLPSMPSIFAPSSDDMAAVSKLSVLNGAITAVGPDHYCADPAASRPSNGFVIFAPCSTLGVEDAEPAVAGIVTVQVGAARSATVGSDPAALAAVLEGSSGPAILARGGDADTVSVKSVSHRDDRVAVYFTDDAPAFIEGAQEAEWRSFVDLAGRLITVSVRGFDAAPLSQSIGAGLLDQATDALLAANVSSGQ